MSELPVQRPRREEAIDRWPTETGNNKTLRISGPKSDERERERGDERVGSSIRVALAISLIVHYGAKLLLLLITCRMSISHDHLVAVVCFLPSFLIIEMENRLEVAWHGPARRKP
jgi:hypothetical protein